MTDASATPGPEQVREIAKEAYVYGFPMVDGYRIQHAYFVDRDNPQYKGGWNEIHSMARVFTPADTAIQTPNSDTPYSMLGADLRAEPLVLTVPPIAAGRYYSLQFVDGYTHDYAYVGSRTTGNGGGTYLLAGPRWDGEAPAGVDDVIRSATDFSLVIYRTQLFGPDDVDAVQRIQAGYVVQPLSAFQNSPAGTAPPIDFVAPLTPDEQRTSPRFFQVLDFVLRTAPVLPDEQRLRERFAAIGIGRDLDPDRLSPEIRAALQAGMSDAWADFDTFKTEQLATGRVTSGQLFGTHAELSHDYLYRMAGAVLGIYGNIAQEAMYPVIATDSTGAPLDGANEYTLRFEPGRLPPVNAFWSITMYGLPRSLLVDNPIDRYLINSAMVPDLIEDADGGITVYVQHRSPGPGREANWLPAPPGPFHVIMRLYWPKQEALSGEWKAPPAVRS